MAKKVRTQTITTKNKAAKKATQKATSQKEMDAVQTEEEKKNTTSSFITFSVAAFFIGLIALTIEDGISEHYGGFSPGFSLYFFIPIVIWVYIVYMRKSGRNDGSFVRKFFDKLIWILVGYLNMAGLNFLLDQGAWIIKQGPNGYMNGTEYEIFFVVGVLATLPFFVIYDIGHWILKQIRGI